MFYKENQEALFKEKFHSLDISTTTPDDLINILEDGKVILFVFSGGDNKCEARSIVLSGGEVLLYDASYILTSADVSKNPVWYEAESLEEWRKDFARDDVILTISNDCVDPLGGDNQFLYETVFSDKAVAVYTSNDRGNFEGPLECDFMELWLAFNEDYYV